ncbi:PD-(D/E)XK motif protein [Deinococcus petrolearius]|uniref:PD-(D/E)XK motif protein n=1 Tax=Deinococcus petrolearius TaxID=1751295 RepID=A0ABW1DLP6_9DEIO
MNLTILWEGLETRPQPHGAGLWQQSALDGLHCAVAAGLSFPGAQRVLILRLKAAQARVLVRRGMTPTISVSQLPADPAFPGQMSIELASPERRHQELFALIGNDLAGQLTDDPPDAGRVILARLDLWREFLRRREDGDSERWVRGLFGELWYLCEHVLHHRSAEAGLGCWMGPTGAVHDFALGAYAVDLKTGTVDSETVHISSLQQLTPPPGSGLLIGHLRLRRDGQGHNLQEKVAALRLKLAPEVWPLLDSRLLAAGYIEGDTEMRDDLRLAVHDFRLYQVASGFPVLTPTTVPLGIEQCSYTVNLASCRSFQVSAGYPWAPVTATATHHEY